MFIEAMRSVSTKNTQRTLDLYSEANEAVTAEKYSTLYECGCNLQLIPNKLGVYLTCQYLKHIQSQLCLHHHILFYSCIILFLKVFLNRFSFIHICQMYPQQQVPGH